MPNQDIHDPLDFSSDLRLLEVTDLGHANTFNPLFARLINNEAFLKAAADALALEVTTHQEDYVYQTPTIVGTQIQITKQSDTTRLYFKLDADLSGGAITISLDSGATSKPLQDIEGAAITELDKGFVEVVADATFFTLRPRGAKIPLSIVNYPILGQLSVSSITRSSNTATVTTINYHGFKTGDQVIISGANQAEYNGTFTIIFVDNNSFSYTVMGSPTTPATGTIKASNPSDITISAGDRVGLGNFGIMSTITSKANDTRLSPMCDISKALQLTTSSTSTNWDAIKLADNKYLVLYYDANTFQLQVAIVSLTATGAVLSTPAAVASNLTFAHICALSSTTALVTAYSGTAVTCRVVTISGNSVSCGSTFVLNVPQNAYGGTLIALTSTTAIFLYSALSGSTFYLSGYVLTVSGTTVSAGAQFTSTYQTSGSSGYVSAMKWADDRIVAAIYSDSTGTIKFAALQISGTTISLLGNMFGAVTTGGTSNTRVGLYKYGLNGLIMWLPRIGAPTCHYTYDGNSSFYTLNTSSYSTDSGIYPTYDQLTVEKAPIQIPETDYLLFTRYALGGGTSSYMEAQSWRLRYNIAFLGDITTIAPPATSKYSTQMLAADAGKDCLVMYAYNGVRVLPLYRTTPFAGVAKTGGSVGDTVPVYQV